MKKIKDFFASLFSPITQRLRPYFRWVDRLMTSKFAEWVGSLSSTTWQWLIGIIVIVIASLVFLSLIPSSSDSSKGVTPTSSSVTTVSSESSTTVAVSSDVTGVSETTVKSASLDETADKAKSDLADMFSGWKGIVMGLVILAVIIAILSDFM